ncbi:MAG: hypothetical protein HY821_22420 [Acidobacteria bacterium]|nr:hypothetical protein [Acidobacteriota bacterium]
MKRRQVLGPLMAAVQAGQVWAEALTQPVLRVDVPAPTKDKPQSKLWFAHGTWWAWLPVRGGSSVWRRTEAGWRRQEELDAALRGLPGQADVWAGGDSVRAVLVEPSRLAVATLRWDARTARYRAAGAAAEFDPGGETETATIARDGAGRDWFAYNSGGRMWVRASGRSWTAPIEVSRVAASGDDICAVVALPGEIAVIWSDQEHDAVYFRRHSDRARPEEWAEIEVIEEGNKTADDHIHIAARGDGALFVATKNSVDRVGAPQQVLRVRSAKGRWTNHGYALLTESEQPTRPIAQLTEDGARLFLLHTIGLKGQRPARSVIVCRSTSPAELSFEGGWQRLIDGGAAVNNVTGSKARLPRGRPWIVRASDAEGRVYEGRLDGGGGGVG